MYNKQTKNKLDEKEVSDCDRAVKKWLNEIEFTYGKAKNKLKHINRRKWGLSGLIETLMTIGRKWNSMMN